VKKRIAIAGGALFLLGAGSSVVGAQDVCVSRSSPAVELRPIAGQAMGQPATLAFPSSAEMESRQQKFEQGAASKLGITVERLRQALAEAQKEAGLPEGVFVGGALAGNVVALVPYDAAAGALGLSLDQLQQELKSKTLAEVAKDRGVDPNTVANALKAAERGRIEADAGRGTMPKEIAERLKAGVDERVDRLMQQRLPTGLGIQFTTATAAVVSPNPMPHC
jgi:predicted transcriptional regulator